MPRFAALALALLAAVAPAKGSGPAADTFGLWFGGLKAGTLSFAAGAGPEGWSLEAVGTPADWLSALYSARLRAEGEGPAGPSGPAPGRFAADLAFGDDRQFVEVTRGPDGEPRVRAEPAFRERPWQIDPAGQGDAADPTSLAAALLTPAPPGALCGRTAALFDGRRRSRVTLGPAVRDAAGFWLCEGVWERVAGYRAKDLAKGPVPVRTVFAEGGDGLARLVRVEVDTGWGRAVAAR